MANETSTPRAGLAGPGSLLNKVPEVTIWFWIIKILCTTVGESFADWVSVDVGVGLINTALLFAVALAAVLALQMRSVRYHPVRYWLAILVTVLSVTGTLYTDILTDRYHVSLSVTTPLFAAVLAVVFGIWFLRERTLSIHSIVTRPREAFYWLAILVTFALGTAAGDWTLELTGWTPGVSVLLPSVLIAAVVVGWRLGGGAVLSFWLAYVLTRPLGANLGDWLALPRADGGLNLGTAITSVIFLAAIAGTVIYLAVAKPDVIDPASDAPTALRDPQRERVMLGYFGAVVVAAIAVLAIANSRPHRDVSAEETTGNISSGPVQVGPQAANFPAADVAQLTTIVDDTTALLTAGDQAGATQRIKDLETAWDKAQSRLQPLDKPAWNVLDGEIDTVLSALRASRPDAAKEQQTLAELRASLAR